MKPTNLRNQLLILGAQARLQTLDRERNELLKILNQEEDSEEKIPGILKHIKAKKPFRYNGKHWTQTAKGRKILRDRALKMQLWKKAHK